MKGIVEQKNSSGLPSRAACNKCHFWEKYDDAEDGLCRFNPPSGSDGFPETEPADWCGKFQSE